MISIGFLLFLVFPAVQKYFPIIPEMENTENRKLADKPVFDPGFLDPYPTEYEKYYNDHFSLRNQLVRLKSSLIVNTLHKSPMPDKVVFGKEGWLYIVHNELAEYRGTNLIRPDVINDIVDEMKRRKDYLKVKNSKLYVVVAPTKYTVYPEYLPAYVDKINKTTRTDQIVTALRKNDIDILDLRPVEINAKGKRPLYYKTDNHWNNLGAFTAYEAIIKWLKKDFPNLPDLSIDDFEVKEEIIQGKNTANMLNMVEQFEDIKLVFNQKFSSKAMKVNKVGYPIPEGFPYPWAFETNYETGVDSLPKILVIHDSFTNALIPFMNQSFNRSVFIFDAWNYKSNEHIVRNEHPDIVLYIVLESLWNGFITGIDKSPVGDLSLENN
jgi:hypothetical protein